ncbi:SDH family Clp fold serine proteinase [Oligoflexus tunisiensis]|uniref:SDH family Clp fold serine proteinase n=1 Tax=Oligoflexus tunisiensis TaxID=708132 RepID=UPI000A426D60|nr:ATP-dependent Clp protease proteolytic subunit [Oligoflexus tunisiensis]
MDVSTLFWIFLFYMALQPAFRQKMLDSSRQKMLERIERQRNSRVIVLVHRQETMSFFGLPLISYINVEDSEQVIRAIHLTDPEVPIDLVIHTPGGLALAALQIARAVNKHKGKVTVFIPHYAMSGGTIIALAADEIAMCEHAVLGPVDPQIGGMPAASIIKVLEKKPIADIDDKTLILADQAEKALTQIEESVFELLADDMPAEKARSIAQTLSSGTWTHDHPITFEKAQSLGLPVSSNVPIEIMKLMQLYPQPVKKRPTVEYTPSQRGIERENGTEA